MSSLLGFLKVIKVEHSIFTLPFVVITVIVNKYHVFEQISQFILLIFGVVFTRAIAMGFNRLIDLRYDKLNPRTKNRELVIGLISVNKVIIYLNISFIILLYIIYTLYKYKIMPIYIILAPIFIGITCIYSYVKRFSQLCHIYLGLTIGMVPIATDIVLGNHITINGIILYIILGAWIAGFDIIYSIMDINIDKKLNLNSIPVKLGIQQSIVLAKILYLISSLGIILLGLLNNMGYIYIVGSIISICFLASHFYIIYDKNSYKLVKVSEINKVIKFNGLFSIINMLSMILDSYLVLFFYQNISYLNLYLNLLL